MIREALLAQRDISGIQRLIQIGADNEDLLPRSREEIEGIIEQGHFYVADHDLGIVGCAALEVYSARLAEVRSVAVLDGFRRTQLGTLLVGKCIEEARKLGIVEVLSVTHQVEFFESVGFSTQLRGQTPMFLRL